MLTSVYAILSLLCLVAWALFLATLVVFAVLVVVEVGRRLSRMVHIAMMR